MPTHGLTSSSYLQRWFAAVILLIALPLGIAVTLSPMLAGLLLVVLLFGLACAFWPRFEVLMLGAYLLMQDPLQMAVGGDTQLALWVKRSDEFLILGLGLIALLAWNTRKTLAHRKVVLMMLGCLLPMLIATILQKQAWVPAGIDLVLVSKPFLLFIIGANIALEEKQFPPLISRLCWIFTAVLALAFVFLFLPELQYRYLGPLDNVEERMGLLVAQGWFINTSSYAWLAVATFTLSFAAYLSYRRPIYLMQALFAALCVTLTWRRKSMLAVAVILILPLFVSRVRQTRWRVVLLGALAVVVLFTLLAPYVTALTQRTVDEYGSSDPYDTGRSALYYTSSLIARDYFPLGTGLASFGSHPSRMYYSNVYYEYGLADMYGLSPSSPYFIVDTYWPMLLGQGGGFSALSFLMLLVTLGVVAMRHLMKSGRDLFLPLAVLLLIAGSLVESVASHFYGSSLQAATVFLLAGIYWRDRCIESASTTSEDHGRHGSEQNLQIQGQ